MKSIHLIRYSSVLSAQIKLIDKSAQIYSSGFWDITEARAKALINGKIYFHLKQLSPSNFGGTILTADLMPDGSFIGRVQFTFKYEYECKNIKTPQDGWGQELKFTGF